jgi:hypothetical protein
LYGVEDASEMAELPEEAEAGEEHEESCCLRIQVRAPEFSKSYYMVDADLLIDIYIYIYIQICCLD